MAKIRSFKALRPRVDIADRVAALPYDVYNREEAKIETKREPMSFLCIDRAETQLDDSIDTYDEQVYKMANKLLQDRISDGSFVRDEENVYYLYELTMDGRSQTGIVACASIDDYISGVIKKHENTRADKEVDRINHVDTLSAQTGPIFLAYRANAVLSSLISVIKEEKPLYDFVSPDGIGHRVWLVCGNERINKIENIFDGIDNIYIADGHHRCASAVKVGLKRREEHPDYKGDEEFNYFLSVLFAEDELMIMDYNRVIKDLNGHSVKEILDYLETKGQLKKLSNEEYRPQCKGEIAIYFDNSWYSLIFSKELITDDPVESLDVSIVQNHILEPLFDIKDPKTDKRIDFVGGIRGLGELVRRVNTDSKMAIAMYPTSIGELFAVADAGLLMPPKSTWFEPKLRSGLFIHEIER